ncbi:MAG: nucleoside-diphosphate kinase [Candidatus Aenigmatarchaeota archaeon]|nr:MAG: nucleoside-diphosphate kinase [Candidatus Aenigmarchaeota archaeon]
MIERTLVLIKPDGVARGLIGECVKRFEQRGLKVVGMKMIRPDAKLVGDHYTDDLEWLTSVGRKTKVSYEKKGMKMDKPDVEIGRYVRKWLMDYLASGPVVALVLEGHHAVEIARKLCGDTEPRVALPGTIRGDLSVESYMIGDEKQRPVKNVVHASGSVKEAESEMKVWFSENELCSYERVDWAAIH